MSDYTFVKEHPVARFYYKGNSHSHPVRRTVVIIEDQQDKFSGFELREGNTVRKSLLVSPIKTYRKDKIASYGDYARLRRSRKNSGKKVAESTLGRYDLADLLISGI